jgi:hypothetical protein
MELLLLKMDFQLQATFRLLLCHGTAPQGPP